MEQSCASSLARFSECLSEHQVLSSGSERDAQVTAFWHSKLVNLKPEMSLVGNFKQGRNASLDLSEQNQCLRKSHVKTVSSSNFRWLHSDAPSWQKTSESHRSSTEQTLWLNYNFP